MSVKAAAVLAALVCVQFLPFSLAGLTPFWGDMTYIHHPWRALAAQMLQAGRQPLWDPYLYFGMPLAAQMQGSVFYPGTVVFFIFGFARAAAVFHVFQYALAGVMMFLWLRRSLTSVPALAGAVAFALGGGMMSRMPFLNHLSVLALMPALLLFFDRPWPLALTLSLAILAGYPPFLPGAVLTAWALHGLLGGRFSRKILAGWAGALTLALAASACLLLPAIELSALCRRSSGMELAETLRFGYGLADLAQWVSPLLVPWSAFNPAVEWWKCSYLGFSGFAAAGLGLLSLPGKRAAGLGLFLAGVGALILGDSNPVSLFLWAKAAPLKFVRYPGNMFYLALPVVSLLIGAGLARRRRAPLLLFLLAAELSFYGAAKTTRAPSSLFTAAGPLVRALQAELGESRYLLSPLALHHDVGAGVVDWKTRLYGLTNAPFRLRAAGNFGEPLVPRDSYDFMDALFSAKGAASASMFFDWGNISVLMTKDPIRAPGRPASSEKDRAAPRNDRGWGRLIPAGQLLWPRYRHAGPAGRAFWFSSEDAIPAGLPQAPFAGRRPLASSSPREDRFDVQGGVGPPGWAFVSEPRYPGWDIYLETPSGTARTRSLQAAKAFQKVDVPGGPWTLHFIYDPPSFKLGSLITVFTLMAVLLYWYNADARHFYAPP